jgi:cytochrome P450
MANQRVILTADPDNIKAILATQFQDFGKGEQFNKDWHDFLGDSIFTTDGQKWHDSRQLIRPQFIKDRLSDIKTFEKHCQILVPMLGGRGETVDAADLFFKFTLDAATDFLLGKSVDSLHYDNTGFADAFNHAQHVQAIIARTGPLNWVVPRKTFKKDIKLVNSFCEQYIDAALSLSPDELEKTTKSEEGYTFLHALARYTRDRQLLRDQLVAVLLAGRDTTACSLSWLFYELSNYPDKVAKLRQEILDTVGPDACPTYDNLKSMKYLQVSNCLSRYDRNHTAHSSIALPKRDFASLPDRPLQRPYGSQRLHASPWRRPRRQFPDRCPQKHTHRLLNACDATPRRYLPIRRIRFPSC